MVEKKIGTQIGLVNSKVEFENILYGFYKTFLGHLWGIFKTSLGSLWGVYGRHLGVLGRLCASFCWGVS